MHRFIERVRPDIDALCRRLDVHRPELFGSAAGPGFDPERSDIDVVVDLGPAVTDRFAVYVDLKEGLEELLGRPVDLVVDDAVENPCVRRAMDEQRGPLYAA